MLVVLFVCCIVLFWGFVCFVFCLFVCLLVLFWGFCLRRNHVVLVFTKRKSVPVIDNEIAGSGSLLTGASVF